MVALRQRTLEVVPDRTPSQSIAFASDRLAVLTAGEVVTRSIANGEVLSRVSVEEPQRLLEGRDGSLLVLGKRATHRIAFRPPAIETHGPVPVFAGTLVFADRLASELIWVKHPFGPALYAFRLGTGSSAGLALDKELTLPGHDGRALLGMRDGSFLFTGPGRLHQLHPGGRHLESTAKLADVSVWRLLTAPRIDQFWAAREDGHLELVQLGASFTSTRSLEVGAGVFDVASGGQYLAFVLVEQGNGRPRVWKLRVLDSSGKPALSADLPPDSIEPRGRDWVRELTRDRRVALADHAPLVAVGGPGWLGVWNVKTGAVLHAGAP